MDGNDQDVLKPYQQEFWRSVTKWLEEGDIGPPEYDVVEGLDDVEGINRALDGYADVGRSGGKGTVVRVL
jgi:hypothetical protein